MMTHYYSDVTTKLMSLCTYVGTKLNPGDDNHAPDKKGWVFHFSNFNVSVFKDTDTDNVYYYSEIVDNTDPATTKLKFDVVDGKPIITIGDPSIAVFKPVTGLYADICKALDGVTCLG